MDRAQLIAEVAAGRRVDFVFFWGHRPAPEVGKECFSQWYEAEFVLDGIEYPTAEHYMMAEKARLFDDEGALEKILAADGPREAKALGRTVRNYDDRRWAAARSDAVVRGNIAKFEQNPALGAYLSSTGDRVLVEASPRDRIWGIGMGADNPDAVHPDRWRGQNLLGFALMRVRDALRPGA